LITPAHTPMWQMSPSVQGLLSLQTVPSAMGGLEHFPLKGSQVPGPWHWSTGAHATGLPPVHVPDWHVSLFVQRFPSSHDVPLAATGFEHCPLIGSHTPATWHWSDAAQVFAVPAQIPAVHTSALVQGLLSLHAVPFCATGLEH
jgi:hypothetical protein